jgi:peptidyl-prolyl cis-trans isomerase A (cyclophilin A)
MIAASRRRGISGVSSLALVLLLSFSSLAQAGTIVRIGTSLGDYSIELSDDVAPKTVQNFLNYVNRNDYDGTYLHRVELDFVVQGGAYRFQLYQGPIDVPVDAPVVNEFNVSNTRGTVAMAKLEGDPDSATNQWFVNLADNTFLDTSNGGFTVFGTVLGNGMDVLDAIDELSTQSLGVKASRAPFFTETYANPLDFVYINAEVTERYSAAAHVYETGTGKLIAAVSLDDASKIVSLNFDVINSASGTLLQANPLSIIRRRDSFDGIATYSSADGKLRIPALEVNDGGQVRVVHNVVFAIVDEAQMLFSLEAYEE